ncbi:GPW/gp25 family protein [Herbidospora galbida]|uniref:GPW/gp25 family protein n=1 Tax=Herbidospora galbida TaxID=2575442 RepID=A0A4U3M8U9_9ACTN|nr:GPW/gp25 family protein [Herbidospora galbida]TKK84689.1 GPW/gp25 family protein [Herbidospora galbida]
MTATPIAIDLPFRFGADGGVAATRQVHRQIIQRLTSIVGTEPTERVMLPQFGVPAASYVFEPDATLVAVELRGLTEEQTAMWEPGLNVIAVVPEHDDTGKTAIVDVKYERTDDPSAPTSRARYVHVASFGPRGIEREVIRG